MEGPISRQVERRAKRFQDMMRALDVDEMTLIRKGQGTAYSQARTRCLNCHCATRCLVWLDSPEELREAPEFCPNFDLLAECRRLLEPTS